MNLLAVGVSHRTAGVSLLERLTVTADQLPPLLARLLAQEYVGEALVLSTCNRVEVYAAVNAFHGGLGDIGTVLADLAGCPVAELAPHLYVHYDAEAARHAFRVAAGLDSMVVGEAQVLGQLREAYAAAAEQGSSGRLLHELMQQALRVGKRAHAETGIDRAGQSVVTAALRLGLARSGGGTAAGAELTAAGLDVLVVGAGAMGALAVATLRRAGAQTVYVANRSIERAQRIAANHAATAVPYDELPRILSTVDIVVCATASPEPVLTAQAVAAAVASRDGTAPGARALLILDLAVPRDVAPGVGELAGVVLVDLDTLDGTLDPARDDPARDDPTRDDPALESGRASAADVRAAEELVASEVEGYLTWLHGSEVAPTVAALRARADEVVAAELARLAQRRPDLTEAQHADVAHAVHRIVQRLLHDPTVRVRELAAEPGGQAYAAALRELFDLQVPAQIDPVRAGEVTA